MNIVRIICLHINILKKVKEYDRPDGISKRNIIRFLNDGTKKIRF